MNVTLLEGVRRLASDAQSGASELMPRTLELLRTARAMERETLEDVARGVCAAQPSMASFWNAAAAALAARGPGGDRLALVEERGRRAGAALRRVAVDLLAEGIGKGVLRVCTYSFSATVLGVLRELAGRVKLSVACAEGRPAFEGRRLATELAEAGIAVEFFTDAGVGVALSRAAALVVGADAITPAWFLNKCGTHPLVAAASTLGAPVYVLATRDKFVASPLEPLLAVADHDPAEVWPSAPPSIHVRNPYFERVPLAFITAFATDAGVLGTEAATEVCRANGEGITAEIVDQLRPR